LFIFPAKCHLLQDFVSHILQLCSVQHLTIIRRHYIQNASVRCVL